MKAPSFVCFVMTGCTPRLLGFFQIHKMFTDWYTFLGVGKLEQNPKWVCVSEFPPVTNEDTAQGVTPPPLSGLLHVDKDSETQPT